MSRSVFISHAVRDMALAREIVSLIEEGMGVPENEIFCSSLEGYGMPSGKNFVTYIKEQLAAPKVVVLLLTPAYFESKFCVSELGAAWIKSHEIFPVLVPPLKYEDVKDVLLGTQVAKIDDDIKYNELFESLRKAINFQPKSQTKWDVKRRVFLRAIGPLLEKVDGSTMVSAAQLKALSDKLAEAEAELDKSEVELKALRAKLADVEALKDKKDLAAVRKKHSDEDISEQFNALTDEVKEFRSTLRGREVFKFVLSDHYSKPYQINRFEDGPEFDQAERIGFINLEDGHHVVWSKRKMKELAAKLQELNSFVDEHRKELEQCEGEDVPLDPDGQDFWEYHYEI